MSDEELTQDVFDKMRERIQVLEELLFVEMKLTVDRTDISACDKVDKIKAFIEQVREEEDTAEDEKENIKGNEEQQKNSTVEEVKEIRKRPAADDLDPETKAARLAQDIKDGVKDPDGQERLGDFGDDEDEAVDVECCVVCGLHRGVFKEDSSRELHHYLSHGFNILKDFDILKPDASVFLICNICNNPFPRKCQASFRKHLASEHKERIIEIFRDI